MMRTVRLTALSVGCVLSTIALASQVAAPATGTLTETKVAAGALKGNLLGDPDAVRVAVYVPPSYATSPQRRYPTLYLLHGFTSDIDASPVATRVCSWRERWTSRSRVEAHAR